MLKVDGTAVICKESGQRANGGAGIYSILLASVPGVRPQFLRTAGVRQSGLFQTLQLRSRSTQIPIGKTLSLVF